MVTIIPNKMNIAISPIVQEFGGTGAVLASKSFSFLKKKSVGGARRALAALGPNNAKFNMDMAQTHIAMVQEGFTSRWNFNPVKEVPLPPGRYQWAPLSCGDNKSITPANSGEVPVPKDITLLKDITNPTVTTSPPSCAVTSEVIQLHQSKNDDLENKTIKDEETDIENTPDTENRKQGPSPKGESVVSTKNVLSKSQICITEFFKPQKRKSSYNCEGSPPNTPPKKKLRTVH